MVVNNFIPDYFVIQCDLKAIAINTSNYLFICQALCIPFPYPP